MSETAVALAIMVGIGELWKDAAEIQKEIINLQTWINKRKTKILSSLEELPK